jgi:isoleucyl-tRNA synthetase
VAQSDDLKAAGAVYRQTLNLPATTFPMRGNLPVEEPRRLARWLSEGAYRALRDRRRGQPRYVLHDGPPYANGDIHMGTLLNKVLKDIINRHHVLEGQDVVYVPGYDTHGLPIEMAALKELGVGQRDIGAIELRRKSGETATRFMAQMSRQFQRLGVMGDWDHPYATLAPSYEAAELRLFADIVDRGLVYKDLKAVHWCPHCETALAEAELEYREKTSWSIWVAFDLAPDAHGELPPNTRAVIWTTTPWTIPANLAIAYNPAFRYQVLDTDRGPLLVAADLAAAFAAELSLAPRGVLWDGEGSALEGVVATHPYLGHRVPLLPGAHVTAEQGTGLVHTAPGHGIEDFDLGRRFSVGVVQPLDDAGRFVDTTREVAGLFYHDAEPVIMAVLERVNALLHQGQFTHQYPHCWRCRNPVIFRATSQWFFKLEPIRADLLTSIARVDWTPPWARERMRLMVEDRQDWCLSRQRSWGLPIPAFRCTACGAPVMTAASIRHLAGLVADHGAGIWWEWPMESLMPADPLVCACGGQTLEREWNVFDVWFDAGATQAAVLADRPELTWPADLVLEGGDQFRGWFNALLTEGVAWRGEPPYRGVLAHAWVLDGEGRPMHKSLGNAVDPFQLVDRYGADVVRLWVAAADFRSDVRVSDDHLARVAETYRKLRNTGRFLLGNLAHFDRARAVPPEEMAPLDQWALAELARSLDRIRASYRAYEFHLVVQELTRLAVVSLSTFYLDVVKDPLYTLHPDDVRRRGVQTVLAHVLDVLIAALMPICPFTADELEQHRPDGSTRATWDMLWPTMPSGARDLSGYARVEALRPARDAALAALEEARRAGLIGSAGDAALTVWVPTGMDAELVKREGDLLQAMTMVAELSVEAGWHADWRAEAHASTWSKCPRCWRRVRHLDGPVCERCAGALQGAS